MGIVGDRATLYCHPLTTIGQGKVPTSLVVLHVLCCSLQNARLADQTPRERQARSTVRQVRSTEYGRCVGGQERHAYASSLPQLRLPQMLGMPQFEASASLTNGAVTVAAIAMSTAECHLAAHRLFHLMCRTKIRLYQKTWTIETKTLNTKMTTLTEYFSAMGTLHLRIRALRAPPYGHRHPPFPSWIFWHLYS